MKTTVVAIVVLLSFVCRAQPADQYNVGLVDHAPSGSVTEGWTEWSQHTLTQVLDARSSKRAVDLNGSVWAMDNKPSILSSGANIVFPEPTPGLIENLELLGRVWGFLKYHHPKIAEGSYNWDEELFRFLLRYLEVGDSVERDRLILDWIDSLGEVKKCKGCTPTPRNAVLKPDLEWLEIQSDMLKKKLRTSIKIGLRAEIIMFVWRQMLGTPFSPMKTLMLTCPFRIKHIGYCHCIGFGI